MDDKKTAQSGTRETKPLFVGEEEHRQIKAWAALENRYIPEIVREMVEDRAKRLQGRAS